MPAGDFAAEVAGHAGEGARGRGAAQVQRKKESLAGEGGVGEIARVAEIGREVLATPEARAEAAERVVPAEDEMAGVGFVAEFSARGRADVMSHDGAHGDEVDVAGIGGAEAEVDVFAAVDEGFVEAAKFFPEGAFFVGEFDRCRSGSGFSSSGRSSRCSAGSWRGG